MNLLDQIKPIESSETELYEVIEPINKVDVVPEIAEIPEPQQVTVTSLDSGEVESFDASHLEQITQPIQETQIPQKNSIYEIQTFCYKYLMYSKEFIMLYNLDPKAANKFSTELELIYDHYENELNTSLRNYLLSNYQRIDFELDIPIQDMPNKSNITINDSIYFKDNIVIIPPSYDGVIDSILHEMNHHFDTIQLLDHTRSTRKILPTNDFKIYYTNQKHCHACKFFSVCDETKLNRK